MRVSAIKAVGDAAEVQAMPPVIDEHVGEARAEHIRRRILAMEEKELEPEERGVSHKYRRRKLHELNAADLVGIAHARLVEERQRRDIAE